MFYSGDGLCWSHSALVPSLLSGQISYSRSMIAFLRAGRMP
jgi:hypothetical protein